MIGSEARANRPASDWLLNGRALLPAGRRLSDAVWQRCHALSTGALERLAAVADILALGVERKRGVAEAAAAQQQTRQVREQVTDGVFALDRDGFFTYVDDATERLLDRPRADLLGVNIREAFPSARETPIFAACKRALSENTFQYLKFFYPPLNIWLDTRTYPGPDGATVFYRDVTASKQLEQDLQASEEKYETLVRQLPAVVYVLAADEHQTALYFSPYIEELTGYSVEEAMALSAQWLERIHPDDRGLVVAGNACMLANGEPMRIQYRICRKDRRYIWVLDESVAIRDEAGAIVALQGVLLDISDRIEVEEEMARLAAIVESSNDAIFGQTLEGIITSWNPAAERLYGYTAAEAVGQLATILAPTERAGRVHDLTRRVQDGEIFEELEVVAQAKDGRLFVTSLIVSPVRDAGGRIVASSAIARDISARKAAEAEQAATHQHTRQVLERITDGFYALDRDWRFTYVNEAAERILGQTRDKLLGVNIWEAFAPAIDTPLYPAYQRAMSEGVTQSIELYYAPLNAWFDARAYPSPEGLSVFFRNVTASRQAEQEVLASEEKYRGLVDHLPAVTYLLAADDAQTAHYFSPRLEALTGFTPEEALARPKGWHWLETIHPDDRARVAAEDARTVVAGEPFRMEYRYIRKDGSFVWVLDECVPVHDAAGQIVAWQGVLLDISDRVRSEEERARLAAIVESAEDGILSCTLEGTIVSWNHGAEKLYGYPAAAAIGQSVELLRPPELESDITAVMDRVKRGESIKGHETVRLTRDGRRLDVSLALSPIRDLSGSIVAIASISRDFTALRQTEQALRLRDRALAAAPSGIVITDTTLPYSRIVDVNPAFEAMTGFTRAEAIGRDFGFLHGPDTDPLALARLVEGITAGRDVTETLLNYRKDGTPIWVDLHIAAVRDERGVLTNYVGIQVDVTANKEAESALARLAAIVESAEDAIVSRSLDGTITSWNRGAETLYGYRANEAIGRSFTMLLPEEDRSAALAQVAEFGASATRYEARRLRHDGTFVDVSIAMSPIRDVAGLTTGVSTITRDITERKQFEQELQAALEAAQAATRAKSLFLAMMSHELRTPLQAVLGYADLLLRGAEGSLTDEQVEDVGYIRGGGSRMIALIDQLLDLSRMEAGRLDIAEVPVDLVEIIEQVRQDVAPQSAAKSLDLNIDLPPSLPLVVGDPDRLRQILLNLAGNAVKFTDEGSVRITACTTDGGVDVDVSDSGIGITAEALPMVFEEFRQVDGSMTRRHGGAGLGLAIAHKLARQMGGSITVVSRYGTGSTFTLHLPAMTKVLGRPRTGSGAPRADLPGQSMGRGRRSRMPGAAKPVVPPHGALSINGRVVPTHQ
jgi:PAS domain S-box-containing protein